MREKPTFDMVIARILNLNDFTIKEKMFCINSIKLFVLQNRELADWILSKSLETLNE